MAQSSLNLNLIKFKISKIKEENVHLSAHMFTNLQKKGYYDVHGTLWAKNRQFTNLWVGIFCTNPTNMEIYICRWPFVIFV